MKRVLLSLTLAFSLTPPAQAITNPEPSTCPSIAALQAVGVNQAVDTGSGWVAFNIKNYYDTTEEWLFMILVDGAKNEEAAIKKGNTRIALLSQIEGPEPEGAEWGCFYTNGRQNIISQAVTPPPGPLDMIARFRK